MATTRRKSTKTSARAKAPPWNKPAPKPKRRTKLTPASRRKARSTAKEAGRPYPTLVDNMNAAKAQKKKPGARKKEKKAKRS